MSSDSLRRRFCLVLVKPSHYDDDGYVIQWFRSAIPSNSLAAVYGIAKRLRRPATFWATTSTSRFTPLTRPTRRIRLDRIARLIEAAGAGMVMMVGVQSNQFPRALDLSRPLRKRGIQVGIGGFHVSGVISHARWQRRCAARGAGDGHLALRRRSRRPPRRGAARRRCGHAQAALQFHERPAVDRGRADPAAPARARARAPPAR